MEYIRIYEKDILSKDIINSLFSTKTIQRIFIQRLRKF